METNHLNNLVDGLMEIIEFQPSLITEVKTNAEIDKQEKLVKVIEQTNDTKGVELLLEGLIEDLELVSEDEQYFKNYCNNGKNDLGNKDKNTGLKESYVQNLKETWIENIKRGTNQ